MFVSDVNIQPNRTGPSGIAALEPIVGALLTFGLVASVAGTATSAIAWAIGSHSGVPTASSNRFSRWQVRRYESPPSTWCTAPPVVSASAGTARLVTRRAISMRVAASTSSRIARQVARQRKEGAMALPTTAGGRGCENFRAYSPQTPVDSSFYPVTARKNERASDQRFHRSKALSARGGR